MYLNSSEKAGQLEVHFTGYIYSFFKRPVKNGRQNKSLLAIGGVNKLTKKVHHIVTVMSKQEIKHKIKTPSSIDKT